MIRKKKKITSPPQATATCRSRYATTLAEFAAYIGRTEEPEGDLCYQVAVNLARAYVALQRLYDQGAVNMIAGRSLVWPSMETAWRELLFVRAGLRPEQLDTSVLSRYGRLHPAAEMAIQEPPEKQAEILPEPVSKPKVPRLTVRQKREPYKGLKK